VFLNILFFSLLTIKPLGPTEEITVSPDRRLFRYRLLVKQGGVTATNNVIERTTSRWRIPRRSVRGFKT
jgi:hypothetical protein